MRTLHLFPAVLFGVFAALAGCKDNATTPSSTERLDDDAQVITALVTIHQSGIDAAHIAVRKTTDMEIQGFATRMQTEHRAAIRRLEAIASARELTPEGGDLSMMITHDAAEVIRRLEAAEGEALDRLYAQTELDGHREVLRTLNEVLIPSIRDRELLSEVEAQRDAVVGQIAHAERLRGTQSVDAAH